MPFCIKITFIFAILGRIPLFFEKKARLLVNTLQKGIRVDGIQLKGNLIAHLAGHFRHVYNRVHHSDMSQHRRTLAPNRHIDALSF